jgi:hypothetical protein
MGSDVDVGRRGTLGAVDRDDLSATLAVFTTNR